MITKLKVLGSAFVVLCAVISAAAAPALAKRVHDFEAKSSPYIVTGEQRASEPIVWEIGKEHLPLECSVNMFNHTETANPTQSLTVEPTHEKCNFNGTPVTVDTAGCRYTFTGETDEVGHSPIHVECNAGTSIRVTVSGCTIEVGEQTPKGGVHYTNTPESGDFDAKVTAENIKYTLTGLACTLIGGNGSDLMMHGSYTVQAYEDNEKTEGKRINFSTKETVE